MPEINAKYIKEKFVPCPDCGGNCVYTSHECVKCREIICQAKSRWHLNSYRVCNKCHKTMPIYT